MPGLYVQTDDGSIRQEENGTYQHRERGWMQDKSGETIDRETSCYDKNSAFPHGHQTLNTEQQPLLASFCNTSGKAGEKSITMLHTLLRKGFQLTAAVFLLFISHKGRGADSTASKLKRNIVFAQFGGTENFGSVNYEYIFFTGKKLTWSFSAGVQPFQPSQKFSVPLSLNAMTTGPVHHLEIDLAVTFYMDKFHPYNNGWRNEFNKQLYLSPFVCYRFQKSRGLVVKTGIGPQLLFDPPARDVLAPRTKLLPPSVFGAVGFRF